MARPFRTSGNPKAESRPLRAASSHAVAPPAHRPSGNCTILLVDDDPGVRESLQRVLTLEGWQVVAAANGEEALIHLAGAQPDLMITDLCMTEISGWDLLFHEKIQRPGLPIFVITALPPVATGGADDFATEFFQKPLDLDVLVAAIHRCLGRAGGPPPK
jgi:two-component system, OmpR family, response regulator MprA